VYVHVAVDNSIRMLNLCSQQEINLQLENAWLEAQNVTKRKT